MKQFVVVPVLFFALATLVFAAGNSERTVAAKETVSSGAADKAAIAAIWKEYSQFVMNHDAEGYLGLHDRDAYKMPQGQPMFQIWAIADKIKAKFAAAAEKYTTEMRIDPMETTILGNYAYSMGTYYKADKPKAGGAPIVIDGKFLTILRKDANGNWKILRDSYSSNVSGN
jgi:ketosteroid isomerase-like protein